ncbi:MAG TPA: four helix bundle protein [Gemmatimonadales bacterium]|nr:four helix bundle protein [Gemmatimonadales bacterium]
MARFRALRAWQEARRLALLSDAAIAELPPRARFALSERWRRAACGAALNLAEGAGQATGGDLRRFVAAARGSLDELEAILDLAEGLGCLAGDRLEELRRARRNCARLVVGLLHKLDRAVSG